MKTFRTILQAVYPYAIFVWLAALLNSTLTGVIPGLRDPDTHIIFKAILGFLGGGTCAAGALLTVLASRTILKRDIMPVISHLLPPKELAELSAIAVVARTTMPADYLPHFDRWHEIWRKGIIESLTPGGRRDIIEEAREQMERFQLMIEVEAAAKRQRVGGVIP